MSEERTKKIEMMLDETHRKIAELTKMGQDQARKIEDFTKESPGKALGMAFIGGLALGGVIALALSKSRD